MVGSLSIIKVQFQKVRSAWGALEYLESGNHFVSEKQKNYYTAQCFATESMLNLCND